MYVRSPSRFIASCSLALALSPYLLRLCVPTQRLLSAKTCLRGARVCARVLCVDNAMCSVGLARWFACVPMCVRERAQDVLV